MMIDKIAGITRNTSPVLRQLSSPDPAAFSQVSQAIRKAKAMMSATIPLRKKTNAHSANLSQAENLLQMAEKALKNGNPFSANDFAQKVLRMILPGSGDSPLSADKTLNPGNDAADAARKPKASPPLPEPIVNKTDKPENEKHTEHTYQDASNDAGVSFSYPGKLSGPESFLAVRAHEYEHVRRSIREAVLNGEQVMTFVSYRMRFDPATGEAFLAGGTTTTIKRPHAHSGKGQHVDMYA